MANRLEKGCTFGLVLQQRVNNMEDKIEGGFDQIESKLDKLDKKQIELFNHQSSRIPPETVNQMKTQWRIVTILTGLLCTFLGVAATFVVANIKYGGA